MRLRWPSAVLLLTACATPRGPTPPGLTPGVVRRDTLAIRVVYPRPGDVLAAGDSTFLFGDVGRGTPPCPSTAVPVHRAAADRSVRYRGTPSPPRDLGCGGGHDPRAYGLVWGREIPTTPFGAWIDTTSFVPSGDIALLPGEGVRLVVRAAPGARLTLRAPDGSAVPLVPDSLPGEPSWGVRAFGTESTTHRLAPPTDRYVGWLPLRRWCPDSVAGVGRCLALEAVVDSDTARAPWPQRSRCWTDAPGGRIERRHHRSRRTDSLTVGFSCGGDLPLVLPGHHGGIPAGGTTCRL
jgi:hypothetical protein